MGDKRTHEMTDEEIRLRRERDAAKRAAFVAQGLTTKGTPRKDRHKPTAEQSPNFNTPYTRSYGATGDSRAKMEKERTKTSRTAAQRRERGRSVRNTPMASRLEDSVRKRIQGMK